MAHKCDDECRCDCEHCEMQRIALDLPSVRPPEHRGVKPDIVATGVPHTTRFEVGQVVQIVMLDHDNGRVGFEVIR